MPEETLHGGLIHPGQVVRVGDTVRRPPSPYRESIYALLEHVAATGAVEVPLPLGTDEQGRDVFRFIEGDVPIPPFPSWAVTDEALRSIARLLRRYHEAASSFESGGEEWADDLADPARGDFLCHNDVCLENIVFRDGEAVGLLDFDFAAPGRRLFDVAMTVRMCGPVRDPDNVGVPIGDHDPIHRLKVFCDAYVLGSHEASELVEALVSTCETERRFVQRRAEEGSPAFVELWESQGEGRSERDKEWFTQHQRAIIEALSPATLGASNPESNKS